jgi:FkbM family methyltransferase
MFLRKLGLIRRIKNFRFAKRIYFNSRFYKGPNDLIPKINNFISYKNGYYIEIGANDGISQSNTNFLERRYNWNGILIEPIPHTFQDLVRNRSKLNKFYNYACCSFSFTPTEIEMTYGDLMSVSHFSNIDLEKLGHLEESIGYLASREQPFTFHAAARTLNSILVECNAPKLIDFFSLDVEGAEFEVLSGIDFEVFRFRYILIETRNFQRIDEFLSLKGYRFIQTFSNHDYWFEDNFEELKTISRTHLEWNLSCDLNQPETYQELYDAQ